MYGSAAQDPVQAAQSAGLRYVSDRGPGLRRRRRVPDAKDFDYLDASGARVTDGVTLERIKKLAIPPAWEDVWICPSPNGHIQATGRDSKGRKQYRYHARFRALRDETKYHRLAAFAHVLPKIRARVEAELARPGLSREKVLATIVRLLEITRIRVGNDEYTRQNESHGLTTLVDDHAHVTRRKVRFRFRGKSGVFHDVALEDRRLARIVKACQELPGEELFQYLDDEGVPHPVGSADVNAFLREAAGDDFTAKDFRTWAGTVHMASLLASLEDVGETLTARDKCVVAALKQTAAELRNRPATCRKYYVHPAVIDAFRQGALTQALGAVPSTSPGAVTGCDLSPLERAVLHIIECAGVPAARRRGAPVKKAA